MIQFISHHNDRYDYLDGIRMALKGGCKWVQLRVKETLQSTDTLRDIAIEAQKLCKEADATFIIDDRVELVKEIKADGVHLGKNDMPIAEARRILGPEYIIGGTANTFEDVLHHYKSGADYIGCGPFRFTTTKEKLSPVLGLDGYATIINQMEQEGISIPVVAIGGITSEDIPAIMQTGVNGIALSGTVLNADNPVNEMKKLITIINK